MRLIFSTEKELLDYGDREFLNRIKTEPFVAVSIHDKGKLRCILTLFTKDNTVGIKKIREPTLEQAVRIVIIIRKLLKQYRQDVFAAIKTTDYKTNRLLKLLGFTLLEGKSGYDLYVRRN